jgi:hypothetical protein
MGLFTARAAVTAMDRSPVTGEQTPVKRDHLMTNALGRVLTFGQVAARLSEALTQPGIRGEPVDGRGESLHIVEWHQ